MTEQTMVLKPLNKALAAKVAQSSDGVEIDLRPRLKMDGGELALNIAGEDREVGKTLAVIILGVSSITRELHDSTWDAENPLPATCFSVDSTTPHILGNPPLVIDRTSGDTRPANSCKGLGECAGERLGFPCRTKRHVVCVLADNITETGLISFPIPNVSLWHEGDLKSNPDGHLGFEGYVKQVKSLGADGVQAKLFQVVTEVTVHKSKKAGHAMSFNFRTKEGGLNITPDLLIERIADLMTTHEYKECLNSYQEYLVLGGELAKKKRIEAEGTETTKAPDAPKASGNVDDLATDDLDDIPF